MATDRMFQASFLFDSGLSTVNLVIALKHQDQIVMALLTNQVKLMRNCLQIELLTNQVGAAQTKATVPTAAKTKALATHTLVL
jgi:hypothetical protein